MGENASTHTGAGPGAGVSFRGTPEHEKGPGVASRALRSSDELDA